MDTIDTTVQDSTVIDDNNNNITIVKPLYMDYSEFKESHPNMGETEIDWFLNKMIGDFRYYKKNEETGRDEVVETAPRQVIQFFEVDGIEALSAIIMGTYEVTVKKKSLDFENTMVVADVTLVIHPESFRKYMCDGFYEEEEDHELDFQEPHKVVGEMETTISNEDE